MTEEDCFKIDPPRWLPEFCPSSLYVGGWLQTLSARVAAKNVSDSLTERLNRFEVPDSPESDPPDSGDAMIGYYLDGEGNRDDQPTVLLLHGMGGHAQSAYMLSAAACFSHQGHSVVLWNQRGAGDSASTCAKLHHPGQTADLEKLIDHLEHSHPEWIQSGLVVMAFSLGSIPLLNLLIDSDQRRRLVAAITVSAPVDMNVTAKELRRGVNRIFDRYLLRRQQTELLRPIAMISESERQTIQRARCVFELDDTFTAPHVGCNDAPTYYEQTSPLDRLNQIDLPTLIIHAFDDPVVPASAYTDRVWDADGPLYPAFQPTGGHAGFLAGDDSRWHEQAALAFVQQLRNRSNGSEAV